MHLPSPFPTLHDRADVVPPTTEEREEVLDAHLEIVIDSNDPDRQLKWAEDALQWSDVAIQARGRAAVAADIRPQTPVEEKRIRENAMAIVNHLAAQHHPKALFLKALWFEFGKFGYPVDTKESFTLYTQSAAGGYSRADYRVGTQYEASGDILGAIKYYKKGVDKNDAAASYRMGMMYLLGQKGQTQNVEQGLRLVKFAADHADENAPQGAFVYGMLLGKDLPEIDISEHVLPYDAVASKYYIEKAAFFGFAKAQKHMGQAYELSLLGCEVDPALSLHYNRLAAAQGDPEAEMAICKWFLCGYEGVFEKNEKMAYEYAKRAALQEFPTAEFAMGYFYEVGVYVAKDLQQATEWYQKASKHGNADASGRLESLSRNQSLSRKDHEEVAVTRIKSMVGSRKGQRPARFSKPPPVPQLPIIEVNESTTPVEHHNARPTSMADQGAFRIATPVQPVQPPFRVITPQPDNGGQMRNGIPAQPNPGRARAHSGATIPARPSSVAPYPEDDVAHAPQAPRARSQERTRMGPPADRPNSAFGIKPLHANHQLGPAADYGRQRPVSAIGLLPVQDGRRASAGYSGYQHDPSYRHSMLAPSSQRPNGIPPAGTYQRTQTDPELLGGRHRLQKRQSPGGSPYQQPVDDRRQSRVPAGGDLPNRLSRLDLDQGYGISNQHRRNSPPQLTPPIHPGSAPPGDLYSRRSSFGAQSTQSKPAIPASAVMSGGLGDGASGRTSVIAQGGMGAPLNKPPPKKGPQTFEEMGVPMKQEKGECVSSFPCCNVNQTLTLFTVDDVVIPLFVELNDITFKFDSYGAYFSYSA
jgi:TPR repeat protein